MLPALSITMANGDVLKQIQRLLDRPETTLPANVTAQLLFAALIELNRRLDGILPQLNAIEDRLGTLEKQAINDALLEAERDKVRVTIPHIFERLIQPVIVAIVTAVVVGAILLFLRGGS
jgi:hypothetical protein